MDDVRALVMGSRKESWSLVEELGEGAINGHTGLAVYRENVGLRLLWGAAARPERSVHGRERHGVVDRLGEGSLRG